MGTMPPINEKTCPYCYLDLDVNHHRRKLATGAAFVDCTDSRYGLSSKDLRKLGGSELSRIHDLISADHEWSAKDKACGGTEIRPPTVGSRIVVKLNWDVAPLACENFGTLCSNGSSSSSLVGGKPASIGESGKPFSYRNSIIHRVIPQFILQGGDFVFGNGSGGESVFGKKFKDERAGLLQKHNRKGILSMGNSGKNSNTSQFFVTFKEAPQCDGKHVVFGHVVSGFEVMDYVESFGTSHGDPSVETSITDCGIFTPLHTPAAGYWYDQPDAEAYTGISPIFMVRPRVAVVAPSNQVMERFRKAMDAHAIVISIICAEKEPVKERIAELLTSFTVDVVIVAPTCSSMVVSFPLPEAYSEVSNEEVILEAKPAEALRKVWAQSWLSTRCKFPLDGAETL